MATLIGFGPDSGSPGAEAPASVPARRSRLRLAAVACTLLLLLPAGATSVRSPSPASTPVAATLAQTPPDALSAAEIERLVRPALWRLETNPEAESAFAFAHVGDSTYLATTYQNVLRAASPFISHDVPKSLHSAFGGVRVDPSFPVHQLIPIRKGSVTVRAKVIAAELERDVAVLRIPGTRAIIPPECRTSTEGVRIGDRTWVFSAGPEAGATRPTRTLGRIAGFVEPEQIQSAQSLPRFGEGGPLVTGHGTAIGIAARGADASDARGAHEAFTLSVDLDVAFALAGALNECPEAEEDVTEAEDADVAIEDLPTDDPLPRWQVAELAVPAVFTLETIQNNSTAFGSGFGVYSDGVSTWVATNHHVLGDGRFLTRPALTLRRSQQDVTNDPSEGIPGDMLAEIVASRKDHDIALVRVDTVLPTLPLACESAAVGTPVVAIGSPGDRLGPAKQREVVQKFVDDLLGIRLPFAVARALFGFEYDFQPWSNQGISRSFGDLFVEPHPYGLPHWPRLSVLEDTVTFGAVKAVRTREIRHTAAVFRGNSGGPLLNLNGEVVGINYKVDRKGRRFAINTPRLIGSLFAKAGIPDPCAGVQPDVDPDTDTDGDPDASPTAGPTTEPTEATPTG
jgi:S1-C subfamily serine protease